MEDRGSLERAMSGVHVALHLAALTRARNEDEFRTVNEGGTRRLVEAATESGTCHRLVYVSSLAAAGPATRDRPVTAFDEPHPLTAYGRSKLAGERICEAVQDEIQTIILRPPAVYGPRDKDLLPFFKLAAAGILPAPTGPRRRLQMIHAADLAQGILAAAFSDRARGVYHVAEATAYTWEEILELMARAVGKSGRVVPVPRPLLDAVGAFMGKWGRLTGEPQIFDRDKVRELLAPGWLCETAGARRDFGFSATIPLEEGLVKTVAWYRDRGWLQ
jgi:nucleoside-diphosphate-sugar epimerase